MSKLKQTLEATARMLCTEIKVNAGILWYFHGKQHRDFNKPACIWFGGTKEWYKFNKWQHTVP